NQIDANRRNALKSTGPKTPDGKAAVSLNSLRPRRSSAGTMVRPRTKRGPSYYWRAPVSTYGVCSEVTERRAIRTVSHFYVVHPFAVAPSRPGQSRRDADDSVY